MGRPSNAALRRNQIIAATIKVMAKHGFDGASVQAIAKQAGLSSGLLHHHFGSKAAILDAVLAHVEAVSNARYEQLARRRTAPRAKLDAWVDAQLALGPGPSPDPNPDPNPDPDPDPNPDIVAVWVWLGAEALKGGPLASKFGDLMARRVATVVSLVREIAKAEGLRLRVKEVALNIVIAVEGSYTLASSTELIAQGSSAKRVKRLARALVAGGDS